MKRNQIIAGMLSVLVLNASVSSALAQQAPLAGGVRLQCGVDSASLLALNKTLDRAVEELKEVENGRALNVSAATAVVLAFGMATFTAGPESPGTATLVGVLAGAVGLGAYNYHLDTKKVNDYKAAVESLRKMVQQSQELTDSGACVVAGNGTRSERIQNEIQSLSELRASLITTSAELEKALKEGGTAGASVSSAGVVMAAVGLMMLATSKIIPTSNAIFFVGIGSVLGGAGSAYSAVYNTIFKTEVPKLIKQLEDNVAKIDAKRANLAKALEIEAKYK